MINYDLIFCSLNTGELYYTVEMFRRDNETVTELYTMRNSKWGLVRVSTVKNVIHFVECSIVQHEQANERILT
jgi:hypothetical protein